MPNITRENVVKTLTVNDTVNLEVIKNIWSDGTVTYSVIDSDGNWVRDEDLLHLPTDSEIQEML